MLSIRNASLLALALTLGLAGSVHAAPEKLTPADADAIVVVNVKQILDSALLKKYNVPGLLQGVIEGSSEAQEITKALNFDPLKDLDSIQISGTGVAQESGLVIVKGNFDQTKVEAALAEHAKKEPEKLKVSKEGALTLFEMKGQQNSYGTVLGKDTIVIATSKDSLLKAAKGGVGGALNKDLTKALTRVTGKESFYAVARITDEMKDKATDGGKNKQAKEILGPLVSAAASLNITSDVVFNTVLETKDDDSAEKLGMQLNGLKSLAGLLTPQDNKNQKELIEQVIKQLKITASGTTVTINLKITDEMIQKAMMLNR